MRNAEEVLEQEQLHLKDYLHVLNKRKWLILIVVAVAFLFSAFRTFREQAQYQATAQILIERETPNVISIEQVIKISEGYTDFYNTQYKVLQSLTLAASVAERLRVWEYPEFGGFGNKSAGVAGKVPSAQDVETRLRTAAAAIRGRISVKPVKNSFLVDVTARAHDPRLSALLANTLAELYIEQNLRPKVDTTRQAGTWLAEQSLATRKKLAEAEQALQRYNEANNVTSLDERQGDIAAKRGKLNAELANTRLQRQELANRIEKIQELRKIAGNGIPPGMEYSIAQFASNTAALRAELSSLEAELPEQLKIFGEKHPKIIGLTEKIQSLRKRLVAEVNLAAQGLLNENEIALKREQSLLSLIAEEDQRFQTLNVQGLELAALKREVESNARIYDVLVSREKEMSVLSGIRTNNAHLVDRAEVPVSPVSPNHPRALGMGLLVGLIGGLGLVIFLEYLDDTVADPDEMIHLTNMPFLGPVPILEPKIAGPGSRDLLALQEPTSVYAEAYRAVRTNLLFASPDNPPRVMAVTSPGAQEGKTLTAVNLAITMALMGKKVLLVDADMRKPRIQKIFDLENTVGLSTLISGESDVAIALNPTRVPTLWVMGSGPIPPNPSELLGSSRMAAILAVLRDRFDLVVVDCTPLIAVTDATVLATQVDGIILVIKSGATRRKILTRSIRQLEYVQAKIIGTLLNHVDVRKSSYYYSSYYAHYYGEKKSGEKPSGTLPG